MKLLARWLAEPHVAAWWGDKESELKGIAEHIDGIAVEPFVIEMDGRPIGYIQSYDPHLEEGENPFADQPFGTLGIDQFIGEPDLVGKGHGARLISQFVEMLFEEGAPRVIVNGFAFWGGVGVERKLTREERRRLKEERRQGKLDRRSSLRELAEDYREDAHDAHRRLLDSHHDLLRERHEERRERHEERRRRHRERREERDRRRYGDY